MKDVVGENLVDINVDTNDILVIILSALCKTSVSNLNVPVNLFKLVHILVPLKAT